LSPRTEFSEHRLHRLTQAFETRLGDSFECRDPLIGFGQFVPDSADVGTNRSELALAHCGLQA